MDALEHARQHAFGVSALDAAQVVLSLDYAAEMILKAVLLERGESIMQKPGRSIGLLEALKRIGSYSNGPTIEILRERRDNLQHLAASVDSATSQDFYEGVILFIEEVLRGDFELSLPAELRISPESVLATAESELVNPAAELQRDVHASAGTVVWAQAAPGSNALGVFVQVADAGVRRLTPESEFEYMPHTDGRYVVAYRQSGGVVLYDLSIDERRVLSEQGGPTDIRNGFVAAQGLGIPGGLGGGVWIYSMADGSWSQLSDTGDSARLTDQRVIWQQMSHDTMTVRGRDLRGGEVEVVVTGMGHPAPSGGMLAASTWRGSDPEIVLYDETQKGRLRTTGIFPHLDGSRLAFLRPAEEGHDLIVMDVDREAVVVNLRAVGFPAGSGPVVDGDWVYFESASDRGIHAVYRSAIGA